MSIETPAWSQDDEDEYQLSTGIDGIAFDDVETKGSEKPHHVARSIYHSPNHLKHFKSLPVPKSQRAGSSSDTGKLE